ncbi:MAG: acetyltransferase [Phycisphaerales bacterium]
MPVDRSGVILLGGGGHAAVVAESAISCGLALAGFFDDDTKLSSGSRLSDLYNCPYLGAISDAAELLKQQPSLKVHAAVGCNRLRAAWLTAFDDASRWQRVVDRSALVSGSAAIGQGTCVLPRAVVNAGARVGNGCIINTAAVIEHDCNIGHSSHIAPGAIIGGGVHIGSHTLIGLGAVVLPEIRIGETAVVGAGAIVIRDVESGATVVGNPSVRLKHG